MSWICCLCDTPNVDAFLFHSFILETTNAFSILAGADDTTSSDFLKSPPAVFNPSTWSSPKSSLTTAPYMANSVHASRSLRHSSSSSTTSATNTRSHTQSTSVSHPRSHQNNWRTLVVNCASLWSKKAALEAAVYYTQPDAIIGCESHLDDTINTSECFPPGYKVMRKDRNRHGGGVFLAFKECYSPCALPDTDTNCEIIWASIALQGEQTMYIGSFYRPPDSGLEDLVALRASLEALPQNANTKTTILAGDFNAPGILWEDGSIKPSCDKPSINREVLDIANDHGLTQMQKGPTRENNLLDLYLTNNPTLIRSCDTVPGISDHEMLVVDSNISPPKIKPKPRKIFQYTKADWDKVRSDLPDQIML